MNPGKPPSKKKQTVVPLTQKRFRENFVEFSRKINVDGKMASMIGVSLKEMPNLT